MLVLVPVRLSLCLDLHRMCVVFKNCCDGGGCACGYSFRLLLWFRVWSSDGGCRPPSSARACFWCAFCPRSVLRCFLLLFSCDAVSLFLMLLSLALCVPRFERSHTLLFIRVFLCRPLSMLLLIRNRAKHIERCQRQCSGPTRKTLNAQYIVLWCCAFFELPPGY